MHFSCIATDMVLGMWLLFWNAIEENRVKNDFWQPPISTTFRSRTSNTRKLISSYTTRIMSVVFGFKFLKSTRILNKNFFSHLRHLSVIYMMNEQFPLSRVHRTTWTRSLGPGQFWWDEVWLLKEEKPTGQIWRVMEIWSTDEWGSTHSTNDMKPSVCFSFICSAEPACEHFMCNRSTVNRESET